MEMHMFEEQLKIPKFWIINVLRFLTRDLKMKVILGIKSQLCRVKSSLVFFM